MQIPCFTNSAGMTCNLNFKFRKPWIGWASEIKYGLIAAARGAFTSWRLISFNRIVNHHETRYARYVNAYIHSLLSYYFNFLITIGRCDNILHCLIACRRHHVACHSGRERLYYHSSFWLSFCSLIQCLSRYNAFQTRNVVRACFTNKHSQQRPIQGWLEVMILVTRAKAHLSQLFPMLFKFGVWYCCYNQGYFPIYLVSLSSGLNQNLC